MYYGLTNFYQNHRRYVKSRDDNQLAGADIKSSDDLGSDCEPYLAYTDPITGQKIPYAPCGAIANSLFNGECLQFICRQPGFRIPYY